MKRSLLLGITTSVLVATLAVATNSRVIGSVLTIITCATTTPCEEGNDTSTGAGLLGQSKFGHGVIGNALFNSTNSSNGESAVFGQDLSTAGVYNMGVQGTSVRGYGVRGRSSSNIGVRGDSTNGAGLYGTSTNNYAIEGLGGPIGLYAQGSSYGAFGSSNNIGLYGFGTGVGVYAQSSSGNALDANTNGTSVWAISASSPNGSGVLVNGGSRGADVTGSYIGVVARSSTFPLVAANPSGTIVFYVDTSGNVYYHGALRSFAVSQGGTTAVTSYTRATTPAIEETGTARLVFGTANVYLSPSFARSVDPRLGYQVFLTPGGDTRGLYVVSKYASAFTVREVQGGRGTFTFDYHVYARNEEPANAAALATPVAPVLPRQTIKLPALPPTQARP